MVISKLTPNVEGEPVLEREQDLHHGRVDHVHRRLADHMDGHPAAHTAGPLLGRGRIHDVLLLGIAYPAQPPDPAGSHQVGRLAASRYGPGVSALHLLRGLHNLPVVDCGTVCALTDEAW